MIQRAVLTPENLPVCRRIMCYLVETDDRPSTSWKHYRAVSIGQTRVKISDELHEVNYSGQLQFLT